MDLSEQTLRAIYEGNSPPNEPYVGNICPDRYRAVDTWPYNGGSDADFEQFIHELTSDLKRSDLLTVEAYCDDYLGGFASYVDIFFSKKESSPTRNTRRAKRAKEFKGISVKISTFAPIAVFGKYLNRIR